MTAKKHLLIGGLFILIGIVNIIYSLSSKTTEAKKELSDNEICYGSGSTFEQQVTACGRIIKNSQQLYPEIEKTLQEVANNASGARNQISKIAKDFYSENLSGTNIDFQ